MGCAGFLQAGVLLLPNPAPEPGFTCSLCPAVGCVKLWLDHSVHTGEGNLGIPSLSVSPAVLGWTGSISERFAPNPDRRHQPQRLAGWDDTHFSAGNPGAGLPIGIFEKLSRKIVIMPLPRNHGAVWLGEPGSPETAAEEQDAFINGPHITGYKLIPKVKKDTREHASSEWEIAPCRHMRMLKPGNR